MRKLTFSLPHLVGPEQNPLERIEVRPRIAEGGDETIRVLGEELFVTFGRQRLAVRRERRAFRPFDDITRRCEDVAVDLETHVLPPKSKSMQKRGVRLRREDVDGSRLDSE